VIPKPARRLSEAITVVVVVSLGVRLAAWFIEPILPALVTLCVVAAVLLMATSRR
jgi:CHASE2 domain-containing sensor protein